MLNKFINTVISETAYWTDGLQLNKAKSGVITLLPWQRNC